MENKFVEVNGIKAEYYDTQKSINEGKGPVVIMIHGWCSCNDVYEGIIKNMQRYRCIAPKLPGFSSEEMKKHDIESYVEFLHNFVKKLGIKDFVMIGCSFGATITIAYSLKYGLEKMILGCPYYETEQLATGFKIIPKIVELPGIQKVYDVFHKGMAEVYRNSSKRAIKESAQSMTKVDFDFSKINLRTLIVAGDKDIIMKNPEKLNYLIKNSELKILEGAGHFSFFSKHEELAKIFIDFLNKEN